MGSNELERFAPREQLAKHNPQASSYIYEIVPHDKELLRETVQRKRPDSINYEDSWGYIIQATRYGGFKWHDPQNDSLIFFGRKSDTNPTLVVPNFFSSPSYLSEIVEKVQTALNAPQTILKNVNPQDVDKLTSYGFRPYKENERWDADARFDDQTYPQQIVDLKKLAEAKGTAYRPLRKALNKKPNIIFRCYQEPDKAAVLKMLVLKDGNTDNSEKERGMYFSSHAMYPEADIDKFVICDKRNGDVIGFTATSDINSKNTTLVASIFNPEITVNTRNKTADPRRYIVSIWGIYHTLVKKHQDGFQLVNLGGCETEGPRTFLKRTFSPSIQKEKIHLIYDNPHVS